LLRFNANVNDNDNENANVNANTKTMTEKKRVVREDSALLMYSDFHLIQTVICCIYR
jgi:hypothetical protein